MKKSSLFFILNIFLFSFFSCSEIRQNRSGQPVQIDPAETFKMVAKLKANQTGTAPIFMNTDFEANHFNVQRIIRPNIFILAIHHNILP